MRFLSLSILILISLLNYGFGSFGIDGSVKIDSNFGEAAADYNKPLGKFGANIKVNKKIDENKDAQLILGVGNNVLGTEGKLKYNQGKFNTTMIATGIFHLLSKSKYANLAVVISKYLESIGELGLAAGINLEKEPSVGALYEKEIGNYSLQLGGLFNIIQKTFDNYGLKITDEQSIFGFGKSFGDFLVQLKNEGISSHKYFDLAHSLNMYYNYTSKYLAGVGNFNANKNFGNGVSYNANGVFSNYSLYSNAQLKYNKYPFEVLGGFTGVNGLVKNQIMKYIVVNYFTKIMEKFVTLQGTLDFNPGFAPGFLVAVSDIGDSTISLGYNGNLRGFKNAIYGIVYHSFKIEENPINLVVRIGGLQNNLLGIIQVSGNVAGNKISMEGNIYTDGNYNLADVEELRDLKRV